jgi:hypothetical protein
MIAHAGGLDEILIAGAVVAVLLLLRKPRGSTEDGPREGPCLYCGAPLRAADTRCASCGFRAAPAPTSSASDAER